MSLNCKPTKDDIAKLIKEKQGNEQYVKAAHDAFIGSIRPYKEILAERIIGMNLKCPCCGASISEYYENNTSELEKILQDYTLRTQPSTQRVAEGISES
ncbi:hypothetical protein LJB89_02335 [Tyzzerella sp. OttesenSCG-928-J15]|nr:hypothetical protein [Tyzzerella sp. OttesenSCG-928-J15]